jgi:hypothetical protein
MSWPLRGRILVVILTLFLVGCPPSTTEIERKIDRSFDDIIVPITKKAITEVGVRTATLQGGAQVINPGYDIVIEGFLVQGFKGRALVRIIGVSGQLMGHAQGDRDVASRTPPLSEDVVIVREPIVFTDSNGLPLGPG